MTVTRLGLTRVLTTCTMALTLAFLLPGTLCQAMALTQQDETTKKDNSKPVAPAPPAAPAAGAAAGNNAGQPQQQSGNRRRFFRQDNEDEGQPAANGTEDLRKLRNRPMEALPEKNIFSPLDLPTPDRIRTADGVPGPDYWQQEADYVIEAKLDAEKNAITARERITYINNSPESLPYVWIYLEQNLFRSDSDGSRFTPPGSRFNNRTGFEGGDKIEYVRSNGKDLPLHVYDTVGRIDLPQPLAPNGGKLILDIAWSFNIPTYGADRMGVRKVDQGTVYEIAQWFPAMCKYDDVHGWNTLPYLGQGEFYNDFGTYDVKITAPPSHIVCATGLLQNPNDVLTRTELDRFNQAKSSEKTVVIRSADEIGKAGSRPSGDSPLTWHFKAEKVRTFAWTSSDASIWDAAGIDWGDGSHVLVQSVYPKEAAVAWDESTQMLRHSILVYSRMWHRYAYPSATNVNGTAGGMEYPMIIFCGSGRSKAGLQGVTSHEIGHNWFPMMVNSDERRHAWMDEGFNTFINEYDRYDVYQYEVNHVGDKPEERKFSAGRMGRMLGFATQPMDLPADQITPFALGMLEYSKTATALQLLREVILGPDRFDPAFKHYINVWAFKSPQPADFYRCMENAAGMDLAWYWREWMVQSTSLDQAITSVVSSQNDTRVTIANKSTMVMPVGLRLKFSDGSSMDWNLPVYVWYYTNLWTAEVPTDGKTVTEVIVDPDNVMPDSDRRNNTWTAPKPEEKEKASATTGSKDAGDSGDDSDSNGG